MKKALNPIELAAWVPSEPTGIFARRAWYLYELLTGKTLHVPDVIPSGFLDTNLHITVDPPQ